MPSSDALTEPFWKSFRAQMEVTKDWAYFDHAAVGPLPRSSADVICRYAKQLATQGDTVWLNWLHEVEATRAKAARLINAKSDEIALMPSTTAGIGVVSEGFPWRPGENVVTLDNEFPSNRLPWLHLGSRGVATRQVETVDGRVDLNRVAEHVDERTRIIAASWVGYASGYRLDVASLVELAHERGALVLLDAIQGLGVFPLDVASTGVDFVAADGHKWLLGPEGAGILYCRQELLELLRPLGVGWHSSRRPFDFNRQTHLDLRPDAARYEGGTLNMVGFMALGASLTLLAEMGLGANQSPLAERVIDLSNSLIERLQQIGAQLCYTRERGTETGIVTFDLPGVEPEEVRRKCSSAGVALSCRGRGVRVSLHAYNDDADVDRLISALSSVG